MENVEEAQFILAHGTEALGLSSGVATPMKLEDLEKILEECVARSIPMVVANPDFVTVEARDLRVMPGNGDIWIKTSLLSLHTPTYFLLELSV